MKRLIVRVMSAGALLVCAAGVHAQDLLVPAGTLLQCTLDEPNFSSATASVGDPVLCHLKSFQEFGRPVFPRGSMLAGHLEAEKEPGHFVGKGYLKITFDRVIIPNGDVPVPAKIIAAKGYKVDKQGDIKGKGHATRDVVEWMIPPLWPWKVIMLPAKGPRPTLKGEEPLELRLMDDIVVPRNLAAQSVPHGDRPPYASSSTLVKPAALSGTQPTTLPALQTAAPSVVPSMPQIVTARAAIASVSASTNPAPANPTFANPAPASPAPTIPTPTIPTMIQAVATANGTSPRLTMLVLKSNQVLEVTKYRVDGDQVNYRELSGKEASVDMAQVDWRKTTELASRVRSVDLPVAAAQVH